MSIFDKFRKQDRAVKNVSIAQMDQFLLYLMNQRSGGLGTASELRRAVPWLFRSIDSIAQKVADFPFEIQNNAGDVVDSSSDWQNTLGFTKDFKRLLFNLSGSLNLHGQAYVRPVSNRLAKVSSTYSELRYWATSTMQLDSIPLREGHIVFIRNDGTQTTYWDQENDQQQVLYWWLPDPDIELGPPLAYPAQAALNASGVLFSLDTFFKEHADSGLLSAFVMLVNNAPNFSSEQGKGEKERAEQEINNVLTGKANVGKVRLFNAEKIKEIQKIGDGLKELENVNLTEQKRADIAVAMNMPATYIWSGDASGLGGGGVSKEDTYRFMANNIVPGFNFIADVLNEKLLMPLGYKIIGKPETLDVFQEDEVSRSSALSSLTSAINTDPSTAKFSMSILGYELDDEQAAQLDELIAGKQLQREQAAQAAEQAKQDAVSRLQQPNEPNQDAEDVVKKSIEAGQFKRFAEKHPDKVNDFVFHFLNESEQKAIKAKDEGRWITTETGAHVFIEEGQSVGAAVGERFGDKKPKANVSSMEKPGKIQVFGDKSLDEYSPDDFVDLLVDKIGEDVKGPDAIGLRAIYKNEIGKEKLKNSRYWGRREEDTVGRDVGGTSTLLIAGTWNYASRAEVISHTKRAMDRASGYGDPDVGYYAIVRGELNTDASPDDEGEAILKKAEVLGYIPRNAKREKEIYQRKSVDFKENTLGAQSSDTGAPFQEYSNRLAEIRGTPRSTSQ